jgi:hypothetical protein
LEYIKYSEWIAQLCLSERMSPSARERVHSREEAQQAVAEMIRIEKREGKP